MADVGSINPSIFENATNWSMAAPVRFTRLLDEKYAIPACGTRLTDITAVYKGLDVTTGETVSVKEIDVTELRCSPEEDEVNFCIEHIRREIDLQSQIVHPNVAQLYWAYETKSSIFLIQEWVPGTSLDKIIAERTSLPVDEAASYFMQMVSAISFLHSVGVCHRDLKLENTLLTDSGEVKICDFGLAAVPRNQDGLCVTICGTPEYWPPEIRDQAIGWEPRRMYDGFKLDSWLLGITLYKMLCGGPPPAGKTIEYPEYVPRGAVELMRKMLAPDPEDRISVSGIRASLIEDPWFSVPVQFRNGELRPLGDAGVVRTLGFDPVPGPVVKPSLFELVAAVKPLDMGGILMSDWRFDVVRIFVEERPKWELWEKLSETPSWDRDDLEQGVLAARVVVRPQTIVTVSIHLCEIIKGRTLVTVGVWNGEEGLLDEVTDIVMKQLGFE